ncbi:MAG: hypothetical protein Q4D81_04845 [Eubacteriales bacterium]|nr:hypothetical protein [Eubacteriales bacterium]
MKKQFLAAVIAFLLVLGSAAGVMASETDAPSKPQVRYSEWREGISPGGTKTHVRSILVSDGGNYLMTYRIRDTARQTYRFYYNAIYHGYGTQTIYGNSLENLEIDNGKLFPFETMEECDLDIDQIITDHIAIREADASNFILVFRPLGGIRDGQIQTVRVAFGECDLTSDSFDGTESIEMLGVFRFPDEQRRDLTFGENVIQKDGASYKIQMGFLSDCPDGIALITYTNSNGNEVFVTQVIFDGFGVLTAYDPADTAEQIRTGRFGIVGYSHNSVEADFTD